MVIIKIKAGLGNQMFQYAFAKAVALRRNEELLLDLSGYDDQAARDTSRAYLLKQFNITAKTANNEQIAPFVGKLGVYKRKIERNLFYRNNYKYYQGIANSKDIYFEGWWNNEGYFKDYESIIRKEFTLKDPLGTAARSVAQSINGAQKQNACAVSIHVRRGDYIVNPHAAAFHGTADSSYYERALDLMRSMFPNKKITFFVFSDDIAWARENVVPKENTVYVSGPDITDYEELHLMSLCDHHILANSSFSWWGAWLNPKMDKIVVGPKKWVNKSSIDTSKATPPEWIRI